MEFFVITIFILGYVAISIEHTLKIDKLIPALLMMAICWATISLGINSLSSWFDPHSGSLLDISSFGYSKRMDLIEQTLLHHFGKTAEILVFLMGAMAIVEMIDQFEGFNTIKRMIKTKSPYFGSFLLSHSSFLR